MTTLTATLSVALVVFAASKIIAGAAQRSEESGKLDLLQECLKPEYIVATKDHLGEIEPSRAVGGPHLPIKVKRDINSNLIPFPRVGRAYPHVWAPSSYDSVKRFGNGLIPFPRVGRSGTGPKRNGAGGGGSLWFGPRLGKRTFDSMPDPATLDARLSDRGDLYMASSRQSVTSGEAEESLKPDWSI